MIRETTRTCLLITALLLLAGIFLASAVFASGTWIFYGTDNEGKHLYQDVEQGNRSPGIVKAWDELLYSAAGRAGYMEKRKRYKHRVEGFESLTYRMVLYEFNCFSDRKEYVILEVFEVDRQDKTLDYARAGSYKDWQDIPDGSIVDLLYKAVCPAKRTSTK
jgi:hypothetical protein